MEEQKIGEEWLPGRNACTTLCYLEKDDKYLMLHRTSKKHDVNHEKWIGVGGHCEEGESPEECILREAREETGYILDSIRFRGIVTFVSGGKKDDNGKWIEHPVSEYMFLFTASEFHGEPVACNEGELEWVEKDRVWDLNLWAGDRIFFRLLDEEAPFFSLKLVYDDAGVLREAVLNGKELELFDILNEDGTVSGAVEERNVAHRLGLLHGTVHTWIVRHNDKSGYDVLLQKRSMRKDSHPGEYDISSAGHISAGDEPMESARREMQEELGILPEEGALREIGLHRGKFSGNFGKNFHDKIFKDREISHVYIYDRPVDISELKLQESEVESVMWMDWAECRQAIIEKTVPNCVYLDEFEQIGRALGLC
ncbi:8-oxo-dGTP diphosphatase [Lachnospiraceae bacterium]|nr:8-oxo-dGTP diphosphatase [Lachnospiraceae bacterium]